MKVTPKLILGLFPVFLIVLISLIFLITRTNLPRSKITISAFQNKFKADFQIVQKDVEITKQVVERLTLPISILEGIEFELDSTSSAKLAFVTPISASLNYHKDKIQILGQTTSGLILPQLVPPSLKLPLSTTVAIFAPDTTGLIPKKTLIAKDFEIWMQENLKGEPGQYFMIFGNKPDFAVAIRAQHPADFTKLAQIKSEDLDLSYKQETNENVTFHLLRQPQNENEELTFTFFEKGEWLFMTSSPESARELLNVQLNQSLPEFLSEVAKPITMAILLQKTDSQISHALDFFGLDSTKLKPLDNIQKASFIAQDKNFEINLELIN